MDGDDPEQSRALDKLEARRRFQRQLTLQLSPSERLARMVELQERMFALLKASPDGYRNFLRRNYASRRAQVINGKWIPVSAARRACST